jgi:hypothetical protein
MEAAPMQRTLSQMLAEVRQELNGFRRQNPGPHRGFNLALAELGLQEAIEAEAAATRNRSRARTIPYALGEASARGQ